MKAEEMRRTGMCGWKTVGQNWEILSSSKKRVIATQQPTELGAFMDGERGMDRAICRTAAENSEAKSVAGTKDGAAQEKRPGLHGKVDFHCAVPTTCHEPMGGCFEEWRAAAERS